MSLREHSVDGQPSAEQLTELTRSLLERNAQLEEALESRIVIEQAKGILAERLGLPIDAAFEVLRSAARSSQTKLHDVAAAVVASRKTPPAVAASLARRARGQKPAA